MTMYKKFGSGISNLGNSIKSGAVKYVAVPAVQFGSGFKAGVNPGRITMPSINAGPEKVGYVVGNSINSWMKAGKTFFTKKIPEAAIWLSNKLIQFGKYVWAVAKRAGGWIVTRMQAIARNIKPMAAKVGQRVVSSSKKVYQFTRSKANAVKNAVTKVNTSIARAYTTKPSTTGITGKARSKKAMTKAMNRYEAKVARRASFLGKAEMTGAAYLAGRAIYNQLTKEMED